MHVQHRSQAGMAARPLLRQRAPHPPSASFLRRSAFGRSRKVPSSLATASLLVLASEMRCGQEETGREGGMRGEQQTRSGRWYLPGEHSNLLDELKCNSKGLLS